MSVREKRRERERKRRLWARRKGKERIRGHRVHVVEEGEKSEQRARDGERQHAMQAETRRSCEGQGESTRENGRARVSEEKRKRTATRGVRGRTESRVPPRKRG